MVNCEGCEHEAECREQVCLYDFYEKGRTDKWLEITSNYLLLTEQQVKEIREDAIDEFVKYIDKHSHISSDGVDICLDDDITILAEQMKEEKNDA